MKRLSGVFLVLLLIFGLNCSNDNKGAEEVQKPAQTIAIDYKGKLILFGKQSYGVVLEYVPNETLNIQFAEISDGKEPIYALLNKTKRFDFKGATGYEFKIKILDGYKLVDKLPDSAYIGKLVKFNQHTYGIVLKYVSNEYLELQLAEIGQYGRSSRSYAVSNKTTHLDLKDAKYTIRILTGLKKVDQIEKMIKIAE